MHASAHHFSQIDPPLGRYMSVTGMLPPSPPQYGYKDPYEALIFSVSHQQVHAKAADSIMGRFKAAHDDVIPPPAKLLTLPEADLRSYGFSTAKTAALHDIAAKALDGTIPSYDEALTLTDAELIKRLTTTRGVGRWTVEMFLIFSLKRPDVFPVDDFGVREGYRLIHGLADQPKAKILRDITQPYSPHGTIAALYCWHAANEAKKLPSQQKKAKTT